MSFIYQSDSDLEAKTKRCAEKISENMHIVANEPSLALYRLQEHVRKALPPMVESRQEVSKLQRELQGRCYDVEYALGTVKSMEEANISLKNTDDMLKKLLDQIISERVERKKNKKDSNSVYKRLSAHIDLPDLSDIPMVRETTNRIENMMAQARGSSAELHRSHTTLH